MGVDDIAPFSRQTLPISGQSRGFNPAWCRWPPSTAMRQEPRRRAKPSAQPRRHSPLSAGAYAELRDTQPCRGSGRRYRQGWQISHKKGGPITINDRLFKVHAGFDGSGAREHDEQPGSNANEKQIAIIPETPFSPPLPDVTPCRACGAVKIPVRFWRRSALLRLVLSHSQHSFPIIPKRCSVRCQKPRHLIRASRGASIVIKSGQLTRSCYPRSSCSRSSMGYRDFSSG